MDTAELKQQVLELPENERLEVAEAVWMSLESRNALPLPDWQKALLEERLTASETETGRDWEEVEASIWPDRQ